MILHVPCFSSEIIFFFLFSGLICGIGFICSIKHRTMILKRGLTDRSEAVSKECLKLMKDHWLAKHCNGNPIELLKYLDVETYELVGESVMAALLKEGLLKPSDGQSMREYKSSADVETEGWWSFFDEFC